MLEFQRNVASLCCRMFGVSRISCPKEWGSKVRDGGGFNLQSLTQTLVVIECSQCGVAVGGQQLAKRPLVDGCRGVYQLLSQGFFVVGIQP